MEKIDIDNHGGMLPEQILELSGLSLSDFEGKTVLDLGAGLSGFLGSLDTNNTQKIEIDPIYATPEDFKKSFLETLSNRQMLLDSIINNPLYSDSVRERVRKILQIIHKQELFEQGIVRLSDLSEFEGKADIIFISYLFGYFTDSFTNLEEVSGYLSGKGKIIIIDNGNSEVLKFLTKKLSTVKGIDIKKDKENNRIRITIPQNKLQRVITILKSYK